MSSRFLRFAALPLLMALQCPAQQPSVTSAEIPPVEGETTAGPCRFELTIPNSEAAIRAVWTVYDRGRETTDFYNDLDLYRFAEKNRLAILWARHCPSATQDGDIDPNPAAGLGRSLFKALDQLSVPSRHGELPSSKVIVFGLGRDAVLAARLPGFAPERVLASIVYAPDPPVESLLLDPAPAGIPQLVIGNGADAPENVAAAGEYFRKNFANGAPWAYLIQNAVPRHGGLANVKEVVFSWLESILDTVPDTTGPTVVRNTQRSGYWLYLRTQENGARVTGAKTEKVGSAEPGGFTGAGWVPSKKVAQAWQSFERKSSHPVNAKYP
jgi:hypothetical protein